MTGAAPGHRYRITSAIVRANTTELRLVPESGRSLHHRTGQFAFVEIQLPGLREPHPFTIASAPDAAELGFLVRGLGDWSARLQHTDLVDARIIVEGPCGNFRPLDGNCQHLWVAGGVGITPFLAATGQLTPGSPMGECPTLVYCVGSRGDAMALDELEAAARDGRLLLSLHVSDEGTRFDPSLLAQIVDRADLTDVEVAVCGPDARVAAVERAGRTLGARRVHTEDFDIRQGFGPDLSREIDQLIRR